MSISPIVSPRTVDERRPWLGLVPFTEKTQRYFFGREREIREMFLRVREQTLTVLYGQSGLGKTSLLGAGLIPKLRVEGYLPIMVRLRFEQQDPPLMAQVRQALAENLGGDQKDELMSRWASVGSLWELFHRPDLRLPSLTEAPPVIIFDQLEEAFTLAPAHQRRTETEQLFLELADLVENRVPEEVQARLRLDRRAARDFDLTPSPVRLVLTLREDYLAELEVWKKAMPSLMRNRMAIKLLNGVQALEAVIRPGALGSSPLVDEAVGARIVCFVARRPVNTPLEEIGAVPPLLSLLCDELNETRLNAGAPAVTIKQVEDQSADILQNFYERTFAALPSTVAGKVRQLVEDRLVSVSGHRNPVSREDAIAELSDMGVAEAGAALDQLVAGRLLSAEERGGVQRIEITHDVLVPLVLRSRTERRDRERIARAEREREQARQRMEAVRRQRNRMRIAAVTMGTLAFLAIMVGCWAWSERKSAESAREKAKANELKAEDNALVAADFVEKTLIKSPWLPAGSSLPVLAADLSNKAAVATILEGQCQKYHEAGKEQEEIHARLLLGHVNPGAKSQAWFRDNAEKIGNQLLTALTNNQESIWPQLLDFYAPAQSAVLTNLAMRVPTLATTAPSPALRAVVAIGLHADAPLWHARINRAAAERWATNNAEALSQMLLNVMASREADDWPKVIDFFEPAYQAVLPVITNQICADVGAEGSAPKRVEAALAYAARLQLNESRQNASPANDSTNFAIGKLAAITNPVQLAIKECLKAKTNATAPDLNALLYPGQGLCTSNFAFCQSLPLSNALSVSELLRIAGYQPRQFRPFTTCGGRVLVAARWDRFPTDGIIRVDLSTSQIKEQEQQMTDAGYIPHDLTLYRIPDGKVGYLDRFCMVWRKAGPLTPRYRLLLGIPEDNWESRREELLQSGFRAHTMQLVMDSGGTRSFYGIASTDPSLTYSSLSRNVAATNLGNRSVSGDIPILLDVRGVLAHDRIDPKARWERELQSADAALRGNPNNTDSLRSKIQALFHLGRYAEELALLQTNQGILPPNSRFYWQSLGQLRLGNIEEAELSAKAYGKEPNPNPNAVRYFEAMLTAVSGRDLPMDLDRQSPDDLYDVACVYSWASGLPRRSPAERSRFEAQALKVLDKAAAQNELDLVHIQSDSDLSAIRETPEFREILHRLAAREGYVQVSIPAVPCLPSTNLVVLQHDLAANVVAYSRERSANRVIAGIASREGAVEGEILSASLWTDAPDTEIGGDAPAEAHRQIVQVLKGERLQYNETKGSARKWWDAFEKENQHRSRLVLRLMEELATRDASITEFFLAYVYSGTDNIQGNNCYLDFVRLRDSYVSRATNGWNADIWASLERRMRETSTTNFTDATGWDTERTRLEYDRAKSHLAYPNATPEAQAWWIRFEADNSRNPRLMLRLVEELASRDTIKNRLDDFFRAAAFSDTADVQAQLWFLDASRLRAAELANKRGPGSASQDWRNIKAAAALEQYAFAKLLGHMPPTPPQLSMDPVTNDELSAGIAAWCLALEEYPGELKNSADVVYYVAGANAQLFRQAISNGVPPDPIDTAVRLSKAAKYLVHEKDVALFLLAGLSDFAPGSSGQSALAQFHEQIRSAYGDQLHVFVENRRLKWLASAIHYQPTPESLGLLFDDLSTAHAVGDLRRATQLMEYLRPDQTSVSSILADLPADTAQKILASLGRWPTPGELLQAKAFKFVPCTVEKMTAGQVRAQTPAVYSTSQSQLISQATLRQWWRPDVNFYAVRIENKDFPSFKLVFWDGQRWTLLCPNWTADHRN